jgi:hypothetical protein
VSLPPGLDRQLLAEVGFSWTRLPDEAFEAFVGLAGDGSPLDRLLSEISPDVSLGVREEIGKGLAKGLSPRETAALVRQRVGMGLTRALTISRTETMRAYREGTRLQYEANRNIIKGYKRISAQNENVCMACLALDGKFYETEVALDEHVNGRCALEPVTVTYADLGLPVEELSRERLLGRSWFEDLPESTQAQMMGPAKWQAWKDGKFDFEQLAKRVENRTWGAQQVERPLKELLE